MMQFKYSVGDETFEHAKGVPGVFAHGDMENPALSAAGDWMNEIGGVCAAHVWPQTFTLFTTNGQIVKTFQVGVRTMMTPVILGGSPCRL